LEKLLKLDIVNPEKNIFSGEVESVTVPGIKGEFQVLYNHAALVSGIATGRIKIITDKKEELIFAASGGIIEVRDNKISILIDEIYSPEEIDTSSVSSELQEAQEQLKKLDTDKEAAFEAIDKAKNKLRITRK